MFFARAYRSAAIFGRGMQNEMTKLAAEAMFAVVAVAAASTAVAQTPGQCDPNTTTYPPR
jgi:hypothetical protein